MKDAIDTPELSLHNLISFLKRHKRLLAICSVVCACSLCIFLLVKHRQYTSFSSFLPESKNSSSALSGIAAEIGVGLMNKTGTHSPQFFADLANDPLVLKAVVLAIYHDSLNTKGKTLVEIYNPHAPTKAERINRAVKKLDKHVRTNVDPKTGLVSLYVTAPSANISAEIAQHILDQINAVNLRIRHKSSVAEREFAQEQMDEFASELHAAEDRLLNFMQQNRNYELSPRLRLQQERLSRDVTMRTDVYSAMVSSYEQARIEAVRDNPVISIVDSPFPPVLPDPRGLLKGAIGGLLIGIFGGTLIGLGIDFRSRGSEGVAQG